MTSKEFLEQAYWLDKRIDAKIQQVANLHNLATSARTTITDMPGSPSRNVHRMEDTIVKIIDLEADINRDIDTLVDLKGKIRRLINRMDNPEHQYLLEMRYQNFCPWEEIAVSMGYSLHHVYKKHSLALEEFAEIYKVDTK